MSFLLDTHILLWSLKNDPKLSNQVQEVIMGYRISDIQIMMIDYLSGFRFFILSYQ